MSDERKVWLVEHPLSRFQEDVKSLAKQHGLRVVDAALLDQVDAELVEKDPPALTLVGADPAAEESHDTPSDTGEATLSPGAYKSKSRRHAPRKSHQE